ncbi:tRNA-dihydrouridine synthase family protein [Barnesiella sp. CU968]|jgi:tRNA-dihydrouridine synthase B|uniref:tRNA-dihydrouridine synthase family protein n=1 Tax=Barnesiella sp. CU968 TaxID=2780099 RepID=UPI00195D42C2|nr:tRNA-dihydrouridine synthase family protein [Barnesiella sp. CU968]MBJ2197390.1 tRNA-dihydrouridine synthase family protein [Muribaculaceae bacterium]MCI9029906.1 tRNA-dihydrouridine synthase family protein [Muribaculaceae bacterium]
MSDFIIDVAPVQGHTDAAWRHFHKSIYGGCQSYYTPFIRLERGDFRKHDLKDYTSELNGNHEVAAQVIFRDMAELRPLIEGLVERGVKRIDLNTGCPFPLQTAKGRGAGFIANREEYFRIPSLLKEHGDVEFSLKMRLGYSDPDEWRGVMPAIARMPLKHVTLHPRVARQQYGGDLYLDRFTDFLEACPHPVVFNGDIRTPEDIERAKTSFPGIAGVMTARGVLGRPSLIAEFEEGKEWSREERLEKMLHFHRELLCHYESTLCGDSQILSKIKPFWEYAEEEIGRKAWKAVKKASNIAKYHSAVAMI